VGDLFLLQMIKAFLITGILAVIFGFISLVVLCLSDKEEVMESRSKYSTTIGNALLVMHTFFEPGKSLRRSRLYG